MVRPCIYVAGPYSSKTILGGLSNMREGIKVSSMLMDMGYAPFCPWLDYHFQLVSEHALQDFYDYSMAWLEKSDAVVCLLNWLESPGAKREVARAVELGIPVFELEEFMVLHEGGDLWTMDKQKNATL